MKHSLITHKDYNPDNSSSVYIANMVQAKKYLQELGTEYLMDILFENTKNDCLVFVFKKCPEIQEAYQKWQNHEL